MSEPITLRLSLPPSANRIWRRAHVGLRKSDEYKEWLATAIWHVQAQRAGRSLDWFSARIEVPDSRVDPDNRIKPLLDACQAGGAIRNDSRLRGLVLTVLDEPGETATVQLHEAAPKPKRRRKRAA